MKKILYLLLLSMALSACQQGPDHAPTPHKNAFYYWKTSWDNYPDDFALLDTFSTEVIYLRVMDVGWSAQNKAAVPMGVFNGFYTWGGEHDTSIYQKYEVIPTIFITNETFKNLPETKLPELVNHIYKKLISHFHEMSLTGGWHEYDYGYTYDPDEIYKDPYRQKSKDFKELVRRDSLTRAYYEMTKEIQFDCDWTESTRDIYFKFLQLVQQKFPEKLISCTIRLYPYKYPEKAGVPPVKKGMLMCYNVGDVSKMESGNSIFNKKEVMKYLGNKTPYPLMLDYAFPIFEWCSVYRNKKLVRLIPAEYIDVEDTAEFRQISPDPSVPRYEKKNRMMVYQDQFDLEPGDIIKQEKINYTEVEYIVKKLSAVNTNPNPNISLFEFNSQHVRKNEKKIRKIFNSF